MRDHREQKDEQKKLKLKNVPEEEEELLEDD